MLTILVVDDTPSTRDLICNYLRKGGYQVVEANNGKDALTKALNKKPDIIITDVIMPEMNGFELCRSLKKNPVTQNLPIVLCTSKNQSIDRMWGMKQGADAYIAKPVDQEQLVKTVQELIANIS